MEERSKARNVYAKNIYLERGCRIAGEIKYTEELRKEEDVHFAREPEKTERLPPPPI